MRLQGVIVQHHFYFVAGVLFQTR